MSVYTVHRPLARLGSKNLVSAATADNSCKKMGYLHVLYCECFPGLSVRNIRRRGQIVKRLGSDKFRRFMVS